MFLNSFFIGALLIFNTANAQQLFYQDICHCGVTGAGFSTGQGSGSGNFNIHIEPGSTIKKAWLFVQRFGEADSTSIIVNGIKYNFNNNNQVSPNFFIIYTGNSAIHAIDVTADINPSVTNYAVTIPTQTNTTVPPNPNIVDLNIKYGVVYLWVEYEKTILPLTNSVILLNNFDLNNITINYQVKNLTKINTNNPVGFSIYSDRLCDTLAQNDGSYIYIYNNLIGLIGNPDAVNSLWGCSGVKGHFYYQNNTLFGLDDDTPDSLMAASDGLANISSYLNNNDTSFDFTLQWQNQFVNDAYNIYSGFFLTYTTPCDTFSTSAYAVQDTICFGDSVQLNATGGAQYSWFGAFGGLSDTAVANPKASPPQTTTYICTITNDSGCVKTEQVKIWVSLPVDSIQVKPTICGDNTGKITAYFNGNFSFSLLDSNNQVLGNNTTGVFTQLPQGTYVLQSQHNQCTYYDTLTLGYVNQTTASFWRSPYQGQAPLTVNFGNQSMHANHYVWLFPNDTFYTTTLTYTFDTGGVYPVCLVAYNNYPYCADTACYSFVVQDRLQLFFPNVFSPNNDGKNDFFTLKIIDGSNLKSISINIFNRWGEEIHHFKTETVTSSALTIWDGTTTSGTKAPAGTYFYVVSYETLDGETKSEKGSLTLLR